MRSSMLWPPGVTSMSDLQQRLDAMQALVTAPFVIVLIVGAVIGVASLFILEG